MVLGRLLYDITLGVPLTLAGKVLGGMREEIDRQRLITEESIKQRLQELQLSLQDGQINEGEYEELEAQLIERLRQVRKYHMEAVK
jgi:hypothetical protein